MKKKLLICGVILLIVVALVFKNKPPTEKPYPEPSTPNNVIEKIVIEIKGEINRPGIYICNSDDRIYSVINLAGGLTSFAEISSLNMAQKVFDGMVIVIPKRNETTKTTGKVSINQASLPELMSLKGIGEARAKAIIEYREKNGPFISIEGLKNVNGISESIFNQIKDDISL